MGFRKKALHRLAVLSLYRALLRHVKKLPATTPSFSNGSKEIETELTRYGLNNKLYMKHLSFEIRYSIGIEFRRRHSDFFQWYVRGVELESSLQQYINQEPSSFVTLLQLIIDYRAIIHKEQLWRADYLNNKHEINMVIEKRSDEIDIRRKKSKSKEPTAPATIFHKLTNREKQRVIKDELNKGKEFEGHLLRRYLRLQQMQNIIPNPLLLSYTPDTIQWKAEDTFKPHFALVGSTKHSAIHLAYDTEYIDAIIKPSLMYDINKHHQLEKLNHIVNERGPYKVRIKTTPSGATAIPYIKMPYPRLEQLKKVALDARYLLVATRVHNIWHSSRDDINKESRKSDGSYIVAGSGYIPDESMFPRSHYQDLAEAEALWEYVMEGKYSQNTYKKQWTEFLDITSKKLTLDVQKYHTEYSVLRSKGSSLLKEQQALQQQQNSHYDDLVTIFNNIALALQHDRIHKHSELVNLNRVTTTYPQMLESYSRTGKTFPGLPEHERIGMGRQLPDYLQGYHSVHWGQKFYDRFKFDFKRT